MKFKDFCDCLEKIRTAKSGDKKDLLKQLLNDARKAYPTNIYPVLRLLLPKLDRDRPSYRLKAFKITRNLIRMLDLPNGSDRNMLSHATETSCNFGEVVYSVLKKYISNFKSELTIDELNAFLDEIANRENDSKLDDILMKLFIKSSPSDAKWVVQIILKEVKLGVPQSTIWGCFHEDAAAFYLSNNNLKKVCETLNNPQTKLHELEINLFEPFRPMLSKRVDGTNFKKSFPDNALFLIENKFDGERFQLHMDKGKFKYFSRNGFDYTNEFGESYEEGGSFTSKLKGAFGPNVRNFILDGEMMLWNKKTENFGSKGMKLDVKKLRGSRSEERYQPCFCVFDILFYQDKILTDQPLKKRLDLLAQIIKPLEGIILVSKYRTANTHQNIIDALNETVDNEDEGIVVKNPKSIYKFSDRNAGWYKLKMDFFDDAVHDLDVLIMGGTFGSTGKINSFFVGVLSGLQYLAFGRISSGLNAEQLDLLNEKLLRDGVKYDDFSTKSTGQLVFGRETPHIYIEPNKSVLLKIRASELIRTNNDHIKTPYTLRFPRVLEIRDDKPVNECLTMNELLELTQQNKAVIKLNKRHLELSEVSSRISPSKKLKLEVPTFNLNKIGNFLQGVRFFVLTGTENWKKDDIYNDIKRAGGAITYKEDNAVDIMLVGQVHDKLKNFTGKMNNFDTISVSWLKRVMDCGKLVPYQPHEVISLGYRCTSLFNNLDSYGDSFTEPATKTSLQHVIRHMNLRGDFLNVNGTVSTRTAEKRKNFENFVAYFDKYEKINDPSSTNIYYSFVDEIDFRFHKGTVSDLVSDKVDLIIVNNITSRKMMVKEFLKTLKLEDKIKIVPKEFLYKL